MLQQEKLHEAIVSLSHGKVESNLRLGQYVHGSADGEEIMEVERVALADEGVKAEIAKLQLPEGTVVISDPWPYGKVYNNVIIFTSNVLQALMVSTKEVSRTRNACSSASSMSEIQTTPARQTATTMPCHLTFHLLLVMRL